jgi:hypothetical protein
VLVTGRFRTARKRLERVVSRDATLRDLAAIVESEPATVWVWDCEENEIHFRPRLSVRLSRREACATPADWWTTEVPDDEFLRGRTPQEYFEELVSGAETGVQPVEE